ncbi:sulfatase [Pullulanibacillus sp. KACC 23026]|uniref:sulfatase n=1 Tax=Pullulanibacillus sp. KACC 23026 TaxID=3028315 RepID=UPI0023AEB1D0|nr:sulfatase [Pullulanibacillus sp. KACC 23026]WEG11067.1 sulfatase [Pullulanibacillus sp. KACC 23026]
MKVILISLDTLRADHLGCYGYHLPTSPHLDEIARQGIIFENAFASDIPTEVAHTSLFTGKVGLTTGIVAHGSNSQYLPKNVEWLPNLLRASGYLTGAIDNLYHLKEWFARGYNYYINTKGEKRWIDGQDINNLAKPWIKAHKDEDFFLFLHYWDPHTPYLPPQQYISPFYSNERNPSDPENMSMREAFHHRAYPFFKYHHYDLLGGITDADYVSALYNAEIRYLDDLIKDLDLHLQGLGIKEETLLILFGDHGESLTEHNIFWDHCGLYDATVHVPVIMRWPEKIPSDIRSTDLIQHADIMPTILEALNLNIPNGLDGESLWPLIEGKHRNYRKEIFLSECSWQAARGIRTKEYKYIKTFDSGPFIRPKQELYNLMSDPNEKINLADSLPDLTTRFEEKLAEWTRGKLGDREDPMQAILREEGLPFKNRIEKILLHFGITWEDWCENPDPSRLEVRSIPH